MVGATSRESTAVTGDLCGRGPTAANEALLEVTRRIDAGELRPDRANLHLVIELAGIASTTAALR
jgi:hypothetical protein